MDVYIGCVVDRRHLAVLGSWSDWTEWTLCSAICGVGFRWRMRTCSRPSPQDGGRSCTGSSHEWMTCNVGECEGGGGHFTNFPAPFLLKLWSQRHLWENYRRICRGGYTHFLLRYNFGLDLHSRNPKGRGMVAMVTRQREQRWRSPRRAS